MSNSTVETENRWAGRSTSPRFNDELSLFLSTFPVFCGVIQCLFFFLYFFKFIGFFFASASRSEGAEGLFALIFGVIALVWAVAVLVAFLVGLALGIVTVPMLLKLSPWTVIVWGTVLLLGSIFKNTDKVKRLGKEEQYALAQAYGWGMAFTFILMIALAPYVAEGPVGELEGGSQVLILFVFCACFISLFHCVIKPTITSLIILYIFFFGKPVSIAQTTSEKFTLFDKSMATLAVLIGVTPLCALFYFPNQLTESWDLEWQKSPQEMRQEYLAAKQARKRLANVEQQESVTSSISVTQKIPKINWNQVYMIPSDDFSFKQLNIKSSYRKLINAARKGDKEAKIQVALRYLYGEGIAKDADKALYWFEQSAQDNHPQGQKMLAHAYYEKQNQKKMAFTYFRKAARQGDLEAQSWTAQLYYNGEGVAKNKVNGDYWNEKAFAQYSQ